MRRILFATLVLLFTLFYGTSDLHAQEKMGGSSWGDSQKAVKDVHGYPLYADEESMLYTGTYDEFEVFILFLFENGELYAIGYLFPYEVNEVYIRIAGEYGRPDMKQGGTNLWTKIFPDTVLAHVSKPFDDYPTQVMLMSRKHFTR